MSLAEQITRHYGGDWHGSYGNIPAENHSRRDRGVTLKDAAGAPDELLVNCHNGGDALAEKDRFRRDGLLPPFEPKRKAGENWRCTGTYEYDDGDGNVIYRTRRLERSGEAKRFVAERFVDGRWVNGLGDVTRLPYRFTELCKAAEKARETGTPEPVIYFAEGERKADKLASMGLIATAIAFGAKGWREEYGEAFQDSTVVMLPDNDSAGRLFARAVKAGIEDYGGKVTVLELPGLPPKGDVMDWHGSADDLRVLAAQALGAPDPDWLAGDAEPPGSISATPYSWREPATLPRRPWLYGRQLLRGSVFLVVAPGATGKSALMTGMAMALCTGQPLLGCEVWGGPKRVWLWNLEDALSDLAFAIQAAALHWGVAPGDLDGRLFVDSGLDGAALKLAVQDRTGPRIDTEVSAAIIAELKRRKIDVLIIDPFISSHGLSENDNAAIDLVAKEWSRIAAATGCAVVLVHHARKTGGEAVTAESSRGASALVDAARGGLALNTMNEQEAVKFGIEHDNRRRFFRADDAKPNRAPPGTGKWFELVSVQLGNADDGGDSVGVATPWIPPDPFDEVTTEHLRQVESLIASGDYRESVQSPDWAGHAVAEVLGLDLEDKADKAKASSILRTWIKNKALVIVKGPDAKGNLRPFVRVRGE